MARTITTSIDSEDSITWPSASGTGATAAGSFRHWISAQKRVLDVGCACGAVLRGLGDAGAIVQGVDLSEYMIQLGREKWPDMAPLLKVADAVNLHSFEDGHWDAIHTAQVAEHWRPELVPLVLRELHRVTASGGLLFCALDTEELFARQGRDPGAGGPHAPLYPPHGLVA